MKDFSSFDKNSNSLIMSASAISALKEVARQTRHYRKYSEVMLIGEGGKFDKYVDSDLNRKSNIEQIVGYAKSVNSNADSLFFAHGHLKGATLNSADVCFDYRLLSSGDITALVESQQKIGNEMKLYTACLSCDDLGSVTMQILSYDGKKCIQHINIQTDSGILSNNSFEQLVELEKVNAKF